MSEKKGATPPPWEFTGGSLVMASSVVIADLSVAWQGLHVKGPLTGREASDQISANGRLIAAAPELLKACRIVTAFLDKLEAPDGDEVLSEIRRAVHAPLRAALEPAIAKAE